jgi:hypothetical protein
MLNPFDVADLGARLEGHHKALVCTYVLMACAMRLGRVDAGWSKPAPAVKRWRPVSNDGDSNGRVRSRGDAFGFEHFVFGFQVVELGLE